MFRSPLPGTSSKQNCLITLLFLLCSISVISDMQWSVFFGFWMNDLWTFHLNKPRIFLRESLLQFYNAPIVRVRCAVLSSTVSSLENTITAGNGGFVLPFNHPITRLFFLELCPFPCYLDSNSICAPLYPLILICISERYDNSFLFEDSFPSFTFFFYLFSSSATAVHQERGQNLAKQIEVNFVNSNKSHSSVLISSNPLCPWTMFENMLSINLEVQIKINWNVYLHCFCLLIFESLLLSPTILISHPTQTLFPFQNFSLWPAILSLSTTTLFKSTPFLIQT